jgi:hypothetical protein
MKTFLRVLFLLTAFALTTTPGWTNDQAAGMPVKPEDLSQPAPPPPPQNDNRLTRSPTAYEHHPNSGAKPWIATVKLGFSAFTGIVGAEYQYEHIAFDVGFPFSGGVRYYWRPQERSWFLGAYGQGYGFDDKTTKNYVHYDHFSTIHGGLGGGHRWFFRQQRLQLEVGVAVGAGERRYSNPHQELVEQIVQVTPVLSFGISF